MDCLAPASDRELARTPVPCDRTQVPNALLAYLWLVTVWRMTISPSAGRCFMLV